MREAKAGSFLEVDFPHEQLREFEKLGGGELNIRVVPAREG